MHKIISMLTRCRPYFPDPEDLYRVFMAKHRCVILLHLMEHGPKSATKIERELDIAMTTAIRVIYELRDLGLIKLEGKSREENGHLKRIWAIKYD